MHDENCLFCNIAAGKIPSKKVYEDQDIFVFHDIAPWAPIHFLIVPKAHISSMAQLTSSDGLDGKNHDPCSQAGFRAGLRALP
jgi:histidine triad (HIT) family protein